MAVQDKPTVLLALLVGAVAWTWGMHAIWIQHDVAGLAVLGLGLSDIHQDFAGGRLRRVAKGCFIWSVPLAVSSVLTSQLPWAAGWLPEWPVGLKWTSRLALTLISGYTALQLLPLDWSPDNLLVPSNRVQTASFLICMGLLLFAPLSGPWLMHKRHWWLPLAAVSCFPSVVLGHFVYLPYFAPPVSSGTGAGAGSRIGHRRIHLGIGSFRLPAHADTF